MKALFISYNQALTERIEKLLDKQGIRGYTMFPLTYGRGSFTGEPHMASHTWPAMNTSILAITEDEKIAPAMEAIRAIDKTTQLQGIRAFVWDITEQM